MSLQLDASTGSLVSMSHHGEDENPPPLNPLPQGEGRLEGVPSIPLPLMGVGEGEGEQGFSDEPIMSGLLTKDDENPLSLRERDRVRVGLFSDERIGDGQGSTGISRGGGEPLLTFTPPCFCLDVNLKEAPGLISDSTEYTYYKADVWVDDMLPHSILKVQLEWRWGYQLVGYILAA